MTSEVPITSQDGGAAKRKVLKHKTTSTTTAPKRKTATKTTAPKRKATTATATKRKTVKKPKSLFAQLKSALSIK